PVREVNSSVPPALAKLVDRLLEKVPEHRPTSAERVLAALQKFERAAAPRGHSPAQVVAAPKYPRRKSRAKAAPPSSRRRWLPLVISATLAFAASVLVTAGLVARSNRKPAEPATATAPAQVFLTDLKPSATEYWPFRPPPNPDGTTSGEVVRVNG